MNQLVNRLARGKIKVNKLAVLLVRNTSRKRDAILHKHAWRLVSRYLLVILGGECDGNASALQLARQRLGARLFSSTFACLGDHR